MARRTRSALIWRMLRPELRLRLWLMRCIEKPKCALLCFRAAARAGLAPDRGDRAGLVDRVPRLVPDFLQEDRAMLLRAAQVTLMAWGGRDFCRRIRRQTEGQ